MTSNSLFADAEALRSVIKINASIPWSSMLPYIDSAWHMYLLSYFSASFLAGVPDTDTVFWGHVRRAIGPLAVRLSADEMSISIGDSGITVQNENGKRSPASDAKIAAAKQNMQLRGLAALSDAIRYVLASQIDYSSCPRLNELKKLLIHDIDAFELCVGLDGNYIAFFELVPIMRGVQSKLRTEIGPALFDRFFDPDTELLATLASGCRDYIAYRCAELHTTMTTRQQRGRPGAVEWKPVLRPLYDDVEDSGNWYAQMAAEALAAVLAAIEENAEELGIDLPSAADDWNGPGKRIFNIYG